MKHANPSPNQTQSMEIVLLKHRFDIHYQLQFNLHSQAISGIEALLRCRDTSDKSSLEHCLEMAESSGEIHRLGLWVLKNALQFYAKVRALLPETARMAVNVSATQLEKPGFFASVQKILTDLGLEGRCLELEITESRPIRNSALAIQHIRNFRSSGIRIMLDDFGQGYSTLARLNELPVHGIKLDRSLLQNAATSAGKHLMKSLLKMAELSGLTTIIEGLETDDQLMMLGDLGSVWYVQGFLLHKPCSAIQTYDFIRSYAAEDSSQSLAGLMLAA